MEAIRYNARVHVFPRPEILDPQGKAIGSALGRLGFGGVEGVRAGKSFQITLAAGGRTEASEQIEDMCRRLLANPITEDYVFELEEAGG